MKNEYHKYTVEIYDEKINISMDDEDVNTFNKKEPPSWDGFLTDDLFIDIGIIIGEEYSCRVGCTSGQAPDSTTNYDDVIEIKSVRIYDYTLIY